MKTVIIVGNAGPYIDPPQGVEVWCANQSFRPQERAKDDFEQFGYSETI